jgi:hypothetical protein
MQDKLFEEIIKLFIKKDFNVINILCIICLLLKKILM